MFKAEEVMDHAHQMQSGMRDLDDKALARAVELADREVIVQNGRLDDLRRSIAEIKRAHGATNVPYDLQTREMSQTQAAAMAQLQLAEARGEVDRRQRAREAEAARQAELTRQQALATRRAQAWARYAADAGVDLNGTPRADPQAFDRAWAAYLVDLSLGRAEL